MVLYKETLNILINKVSQVNITDLNEIDHRDNFLIGGMQDLLSQISPATDDFNKNEFVTQYAACISRVTAGLNRYE